MLDTLALSKRFKAAGFTDQQADALAEIQVSLVSDQLATKQDISDLRHEIGAVRQDMDALRASLGHEISAIETGLRHEINTIETGLRHEIKELELRIDARFEGIRGELTVIKRMLGLLLGGVIALVLKTFFP